MHCQNNILMHLLDTVILLGFLPYGHCKAYRRISRKIILKIRFYKANDA